MMIHEIVNHQTPTPTRHTLGHVNVHMMSQQHKRTYEGMNGFRQHVAPCAVKQPNTVICCYILSYAILHTDIFILAFTN